MCVICTFICVCVCVRGEECSKQIEKICLVNTNVLLGSMEFNICVLNGPYSA